MDTVFSPREEQDRFRDGGEEERSDEGSRDGTGERYVVKVLDARERVVV